MKLSRHNAPNVNAGSMADIAFLLLIFFLITTTISVDEGINRKLPKLCPPNVVCSETINERNILRVALNEKHEIFVEDNLIQLVELKDIAISFLDNNGDGTCNYCKGKSLTKYSDNPKSAVISLQNEKLTTYEFYIAVQDELTKAYYELRDTYSKTILKKNSKSLSIEELNIVKNAYPFILSEAETK
jgi:biopolymer transport protein ExbD